MILEELKAVLDIKSGDFNRSPLVETKTPDKKNDVKQDKKVENKPGDEKVETSLEKQQPETTKEDVSEQLKIGVDTANIKKQNAVEILKRIKKRISDMGSDLKKAKVDKEANPADVIELATEFNFAQTVQPYIYFVLGRFITFQESLHEMYSNLDQYYKNEIANPGVWDRLRKQVPWIDGVLAGASIGAVAVWATDGWNAIVKQLTNLVPDDWKPIVKAATYTGGILGLSWLANTMAKAANEKIKRLNDELSAKHRSLMDMESEFLRLLSSMAKIKIYHLKSKEDDFSELEKEDPLRYNLAANKKWDELNQLYKTEIGGYVKVYKEHKSATLAEFSAKKSSWLSSIFKSAKRKQNLVEQLSAREKFQKEIDTQTELVQKNLPNESSQTS